MRDAERASPSPKLGARFGSYLKTVVYDGRKSTEPPSPISLNSTTPTPSPQGIEAVERTTATTRVRSPLPSQNGKMDYEYRRDSGLAPSSFTADGADFVDNITSADDPGARIPGRNQPRIVVQQEHHRETMASEKNRAHHGAISTNSQPNGSAEDRALVQPFLGITTDIPTGSFEDLTTPGQLQFSKRGSMLIGGIKANPSNGLANGHPRLNGSRKQLNGSVLVKPSSGSERFLSPEEEQLSQKVRFMYEHGDGNGEISWRPDNLSEMEEDNEGVIADEEAATDFLSPPGSPEPGQDRISVRRVSGKPSTVNSRRNSSIKREAFETAGGIEDWENVDGGDVDRYGFIVPRRRYSQGSSMMSGSRSKAPELPRPQRVSTVLQLASEAPRTKRTMRRTPSNSKSARSATPQIPKRKVSSRSLRPPSSMHSNPGNSSPRSLQSPFRYATNRLPHNKDRRWVDEAGDMLTLPPGLADIVEHAEGGEAASELKRREWNREEKWRKMARVVKQKSVGGGMVFDFNTHDPKVRIP